MLTLINVCTQTLFYEGIVANGNVDYHRKHNIVKFYNISSHRELNLEFKVLRATLREELSIICILYLAILLEKRESNYCIWFAKIASHLSRSSRMVNIVCMSR